MGCLLLGTEDGRLLVLDPAGTKIMHSWKAGGVPAFLTVTGVYHICHAQGRGGAASASAAAVGQFMHGTCSTCLPACDRLLLRAAQRTPSRFPGMRLYMQFQMRRTCSHLPDLPACVKWLHGAAEQASMCSPGMHLKSRSPLNALETLVSAESRSAAKAPPSASQLPVLSQSS